MRMRVAAVLLAVGLLPIADGAASPDDKPAPPPEFDLRFRPPVGVVYVADYDEHVVVRCRIGKKATAEKQDVVAHWRLELSARAPDRESAVPLDVRVVSVKGKYVGTSEGKPGAVTFDSDAPGERTTGAAANPDLVQDVLGVAGRRDEVLVSVSGRVLSAGAAFAGLAKAGSAAARHEQEVVGFFERFFQPLPLCPARQGVSWSAPRLIAPHLVVATEHVCGCVDEGAKLSKIDADTASIAVSGSGTGESRLRKMVQETLESKLTKWSTSGTATVETATGVPLARSTKVTASREQYFKEFDCLIRWEYEVEGTLTVARQTTTSSGK